MRGRMSAVVKYDLKDRAVELREVAIPEIGPEDVLLEVKAASVCGSDVHMYRNTMGFQVDVPVILGHEFCGVIAAKGKNVAAFKEGDRVASETAAYICGQCIYCRTGEYNICPKRRGFGNNIDGAFAQYVRVPARLLHRLPDNLSFEEAALTEPTCVAYNALAVKSRIQPGDFVVVLGPGPIGLQSVQVARLLGAGRIAIAGISSDAGRLRLARELGADIIIDASKEDPIEAVLSASADGLGADLVVDCVGIPTTLHQSLEMVRPGGQITKIGWGPQPLSFSIDKLVSKAARLQGSFSHTYKTWERVIALISEGRLRTRPLISLVRPLAEWRDAFEAMETRRAAKSVLIP